MITSLKTFVRAIATPMAESRSFRHFYNSNVPFLSAAIPLPLVLIFGAGDGVVGGQAARSRRLAGEESLPRAAHRTGNFTTFVVICAKVTCSGRFSIHSYGEIWHFVGDELHIAFVPGVGGGGGSMPESMSRCRLNALRLRYAYTSMNVATGSMMAIACIGNRRCSLLGSAKV